MIVVIVIAIAVGCRHCYRNGRQQLDNNQLTSNGDGNGRRDSDATAMVIDGMTEMRRRQWRWRWMARQSDDGGSDGWHYDCNGRLATVAMDRDSTTQRNSDGDGRRDGNAAGRQRRWGWTARW